MNVPPCLVSWDTKITFPICLVVQTKRWVVRNGCCSRKADIFFLFMEINMSVSLNQYKPTLHRLALWTMCHWAQSEIYLAISKCICTVNNSIYSKLHHSLILHRIYTISFNAKLRSKNLDFSILFDYIPFFINLIKNKYIYVKSYLGNRQMKWWVSDG